MSYETEIFAKLITLKEGCSYAIPVTDKVAQTKLRRKLLDLKDEYMSVDPVCAGRMLIERAISDNKKKLFVKITKREVTPMKIIHKDANGVVREVSLEDDPDRRRRLDLMVRDGIPYDEVEELMDGLTEEERRIYYGK